MTIDEALCNIKQGYGIPHKHDTLTTIIEYVKKTEPCEDAISRQAVMELPRYTTVIGEIVYLDGIKALPSVQPKAKTGKWLHRNDDHNDWSECSECGYGDEGEVKFGEETPYCPYCGSRNEREEE